jgi:hypothetical protein
MSVSTPPPPPLTFQTFLEKMRQQSAGSLVREVKTFIASVADAADAARASNAKKQGVLVQAFLRRIEASFATHPAWQGSTPAELDASGEGLEKYIMTKLHAKTFGRGAKDAERDAALHARIAALRAFIDAKHLDIAESSHAAASWALAESELGKINQFKAPRDKLVCVLNTCRIINNTLTTRQGSDGGADDFLPVLIYVVLRANPEQLESNVQYITRFRAESRLVSEAAYFFTNLVSAVHFLGRATAQAFTGIDHEMFDHALSQAGVLEPIDFEDDDDNDDDDSDVAADDRAPRAPPTQQISVEDMSAALDAATLVGDSGRHTPHTPQPPTMSDAPRRATAAPWRATEDVEAEGATALTALDVAGKLSLPEYTFLYAKVEDLTVGDVAKLLDDYKSLALRYESLRRGAAKVLEAIADDAPP